MRMALDEIDQRILAILRDNARTPVTDIARAVGLSAAPVARRIERMEATGVIRGYTTLIDETRAGSLEAFTEIRLAGAVETDDVERLARTIPEVREYFTISGDPDALLRLRVRNVDHLQQVVNSLRRSGILTGTKTLVVMKGWSRDELTPRAGGDARRTRRSSAGGPG
jgi:Lrp/AsnC family transcriptional regulator, leucine-responsive regulatory protein